MRDMFYYVMWFVKKVKVIFKMGVNMEGINEKVVEDGGGVGDLVWVLVIVVMFDMIVIVIVVDFIMLLLDVMILIDEMIWN